MPCRRGGKTRNTESLLREKAGGYTTNWHPRLRAQRRGGEKKRGGQNRYNKTKNNLLNPKDAPRFVRNPHSNLLKDKSITNRKPARDRKPTGERDMSKVKFYNCNKLGHFASKCPLAKRPRKQQSERLKDMVAQTLPEYSEQDQLTPETASKWR